MSIFISHAKEDAEEALKICELLEGHGIPCFIAPRDIRLGRPYAEELMRGLDEAEAIVLLMTKNANQSPHVLREVERAVSKRIPILGYKWPDVELSKSMEYFLMSHQWMLAKPNEDYRGVLEFVEGLHGRNDMETAEGKGSISSGNVNNIDRANSVLKTGNVGKKKFRNIIFFVVCMMIVAVLAGLGGYYFNSRNNNKEEVLDTLVDIEVGDTVTFGSYNGEAIEWRVLKVDTASNKAVLVSKDILTMKAYDAAEGGTYNKLDGTKYPPEGSEADVDMELQVLVRGNSEWSSSNIRTWLNSADEVVTYLDQAPVATAMAEEKNGYNNEAGFLYGFTEEERAAICETKVVTKGNALSESETIVSMDKVYLLSLEELKWFEDAGISMLAVPTQAAVEQDKSFWYTVDQQAYGIDTYCWWLREPVEGMASKCYMVGNGYHENNIRMEEVGLEGFGVRPAITVNLEKVKSVCSN